MDDSTGFPIGNFGIGGEVTPDGRVLSRVMYNPPELGPWLQELGRGRFVFECGGVAIADSEFERKSVYRLFPEASIACSDPRFEGVAVSMQLLAPIGAGDAFTCSIPAICAGIVISNASDRAAEITAAFEFAADISDGDLTSLEVDGFHLAGPGPFMLGFDRSISWSGADSGMRASTAVSVPARGQLAVKFLFVCHDARGLYAANCPDTAALASHIAANWTGLEAGRAELIRLLPRTHDDRINRYLRWYLQAGVLLTRLTREHVLTMGYCELNQRDSFWTSWPHLVLWPDLERRMIEESAGFQRENGKIPTTVLPMIEREDDIDINEYFNLRIARFYEWTRDDEFLRRLWPSFKRSIDYLKSMDGDGDGLLDQGSFWGDWKDVIGVEGRKAAPHFEFLYLAVLKYAKEFAEILDDSAALEEYTSLYERSYHAVNAPLDQGGLWNGKFYTTLWYDGREDNHVQQDQCVGPLYGVLPSERIEAVYDAMGPSMTDWGIRDTYPYREPSNNAGGDYHNGGVWVFLNFADALSRFVTGYVESGRDILRRVGEWDLEKWGDYMPAEYLDGNTGRSAGKPIQGWDACFYAAVLFGMLGVRVLSGSEVRIMPRIADTEAFYTPIALPDGVLYLRQAPGQGSLEVELRSELDREITVLYGAMTRRTTPGSIPERIGECEFQVVKIDLGPSEARRVEFR